jgi:hypothetical protein
VLHGARCCLGGDDEQHQLWHVWHALIAHFRMNGDWAGCVPVEASHERLTGFVVLKSTFVDETQDVRTPPATESTQPGAPRSLARARYRLPRGASGTAAAVPSGQARQVCSLLARNPDGLTASEISDQLGLKRASVEHVLWKLKRAKLIESVAV